MKVLVPFTNLRLTGTQKKPKGYPEQLLTVGDHIKARRLDLGITRKELCSIIGIGPWPNLCWEHDGATPRVRYWPAILDFLGYDPELEPITLAGKLLKIRRRHGWQLRDLAVRIDVSPNSIKRWEEGIVPRNGRTSRVLERLLEEEGLL